VWETKEEGEHAMDTVHERMGFRSIGLHRKYTLGTWDRFKQMGTRSVGAIFMNSLITMGVTAAAVHMFFNSHVMRENFKELDKKLDDLDKKLDHTAGTSR
jgi:hypothetical protein